MNDGARPPDDGGAGGASDPEEPSAAQSMTASSASFVAGRRRTLLGTGFFKPLPVTGRVRRMWNAFGLAMGHRLAVVLRDDHIYMILMAAAVGIASGVAAGALLAWIEYAVGLFPQPEESGATLRIVVVIAVPVIGGLLAGALHMVARRFLGSAPTIGVPAVIEAIATRGGSLSGRGAVIVGVGTGLTIGSGGSCGHEGPSVAIGSAIGSVISRFFGLRLSRHMAMVGAGCAGGIAAAFNAPLAGVIFTVEVVFGGSIGGVVGTMSVFIPLIVAAVTATFTSHFIAGDNIAFGGYTHGNASIAELGFYVLLAVLAGVIGAVMNRIVLDVRRRFDNLERVPLWLKPALGALGVGILAAVVSNELLGPGHSTASRAVRGELVWEMALLLLALKIVVTALTVGSGGFGGVFMPSLYVGACLGTVVAALAAWVLGADMQDAGAYALVGMGAIFAGTMHAPLTPIVMLFELTHDYGVILPLMLACILSMVVSKRVYGMSFYKSVLEYRGIVLKHEAEGEVMKRGHVEDLMVPPAAVLTEGAGLEEIRRSTLVADLRSTFVVDAEGSVVGFINGDQLARRMLAGEINAESTARDLMGSSSLTLLYPSDTLAGAMLAFSRSNEDVLPVVDRTRRMKGVIRRSDLLAHYTDKVLGEQEEVVEVRAGGHAPLEVGLGKGLVIERVIVGRAWAGRTLAELDLRGKTGVSVLEWTRDEVVVAVDPRKPLREADELAVCGTREQVLALRATK
jgi:CIC family chloride channel protein